jgi:hypothetical protein
MNTLPVRFFGLLVTLHFLMFESACAIGETPAASASQSTELQNSASAKATGQSKPPLPVVIFTTWRDPREGAFTVSVPEGWQVNGGAVRRSAVDITHVVRAATPDSRVQIFINDADIVAHEVPNQLTAVAGVREGQMTKGAWGGPVLLERFRTGSQFAEEYVQKKICPRAEFTGGGDLPNETRQMNAQVVPYGRSMGSNAGSSVGEAYFRCGGDLGYVTATTVYTAPPSGQGVTMWFVYQISGFGVKKSVDATFAMYVVHTMTSSFRFDPQWEARSEREAQALTSSVTNMQHAMAASLAQQAASRAAQERSSVVHGNNIDVMSGWEARNKVRDAAAQRDSEVRRGVTTTDDPVWGSRTVSNNYNHYWTRADGSIMGTTTDTPPDYSNGWRMMTTH